MDNERRAELSPHPKRPRALTKPSGSALAPVAALAKSTMQSDGKTIVFLSAVLFAIIAIGSAILRGGWLDEFSSYTFTDPAQSVSALYKSYWMTDPSAPTYYFLLRLWRIVVSPLSGLLAMRSLSLAAAFVLAVAATYAYGAFVRGRLWVFVALLLSSPVVLFYAEESKSYVFSVFGGVFLGIMFLACLLQERLETRRFIAIALMGLFGVLLCSVQIISVFTAAFFLGCLGAIALWESNWRIVFLAGSLVFLTVLPSAAATLLLTTGVQTAMKNFWITRRVVLEAFIWLPAFVGLPTSVLILALIWKRSFVLRLLGDPVLRPPLYIFGAAFVFIVLVFGIAAVKPFLTLRYLATWAGFMVPATAVILDAAIKQADRRLVRFATIAVILSFVVDTAAAWPHHLGEWRMPGYYVRSIPECRVATIPVALLDFVPPDNQMKRFASPFAWYAGNVGRFIPATEANLDKAAMQACPIRLWLGHLKSPRFLSNEVLAAIAKTCRSGAVDVLEFDFGYLVVREDYRYEGAAA